jgi:hypothetical protein
VAGCVLASFRHACDLVTDDGAVVALVWGGIGNGPLNLVLECGPDPVPEAGAPFFAASAPSAQTVLRIGGRSTMEVTVSTAVTWDAAPDWRWLRTRKSQIAAGAGVITALLAAARWTPARCGLPATLCDQAAAGRLDAMRALVGRGPGLTPAGDDWLAGWLLAQHVNKDLRGLRNLEGLADRTTTLSRALLECAAAGEADESWHALLALLAMAPPTGLPIWQSTEAILTHGATSGAAMLIGFCAGVAHPIPEADALIPGA